MKNLVLFGILVLIVTPSVLLHPNDEEDEVSAVTESEVDDEDDMERPVEQVAETDDDMQEEETAVTSKPKQNGKNSNRRKRPNKRPNNRPRYNQLQRDNKRKRGKNDKQRTANGKKGAAKKPCKSIQYESRSPYTDQLNKAVDDMLIHYSQAMLNDSAAFKLRVPSIPSWLQVQPWAYVVQNASHGTNGTEDGKSRRKRETDPEDDVDDEVENSTTVESLKEEDDDDDDDEEPDNSTDTKVSTSVSRFKQTEKPWAVPQADGSVDYNLQLVNEEDDHNRNETKTGAPSRRPSKGRHSQRRRQQGQKNYKLNYPRRPNAHLEGLELIQRTEDVVTGTKENSTIRIFDIRVQIGPIKFVIKESTNFPVCNVTSPLMFARLRVTESDGELVSARFKQTKIRPNDSVVTLRLPKDQNLPTDSQLGVLVTHLSNEMARSWNSGYLLRRVRRQFKTLYVSRTWTKAVAKVEKINRNEDAKKLAQALVVPTTTAPSTSNPVIVL